MSYHFSISPSFGFHDVSFTTGITEEQLVEIGIATQLLRKSILKAFEALVKAKGEK
jgi:hypothetical protein